MKTIKYLLLFLLTVILTLPSCKEDESINPAKSVTEILTSKSWKWSSNTENGIELLEDCQKDDIINFFSNGTYLYSVGAIKCSGEMDESGTWSLTNEDKTILIDGDPDSIEITESQIVITFIEGDYIVINIFIPQ